MEKRILIGSIIAVVILILLSFTSAIGYRSIESDVKVSPLFNIRSSKAIGKERILHVIILEREKKPIYTYQVGYGEQNRFRRL